MVVTIYDSVVLVILLAQQFSDWNNGWLLTVDPSLLFAEKNQETVVRLKSKEARAVGILGKDCLQTLKDSQSDHFSKSTRDTSESNRL